MSHTKGPWFPEKNHAFDQWFIVSVRANAPHRVVAEVDNGDDQEADANLIAAAPDLLVVLEELLGFVDGVFFMNGWEEGVQPSITNARLAIKKAKGEG